MRRLISRFAEGIATYGVMPATRVLPQSGLTGLEQSKLRRNTGLGGRGLPSHSEAIADRGNGSGVERRSLLPYQPVRYQKIRAQARYQAMGSLSLTLDFTYLNNENPTTGINYNFLTQQEALSIFLVPRGREDFQFSRDL